VRIRIVNTHLDHRRDQAVQAQQVVDKAFDPSVPALLMGDMNQSGGSNAIANIRTVCSDVGANSIDWIFSYPKNGWQVDSFTVLRDTGGSATPSATQYPDLNKMSDHRPLLGVVTLK
jgi:endonuclease/exonuclease/phosphatase family metal-dependent hydrolase